MGRSKRPTLQISLAGSCILDSLELAQQVVRQAIQEAVAIIQTTCYKRIDQNMSTIKKD